jgi:hypothetical protein
MTRLPVIFAIVAGLLASGGCSNAASSRLGAPPSGQALWEGTWRSDEYALISGEVAVLLPEPIPSAGDGFDVQGAIHYGALTFYRPGQTVNVKFAATLPSDEAVSGSNRDAPILAPGLRFWLKSKGGIGPSRQVVDYEARVSRANVIEGTYRSSNPFDAGNFQLKRRSPG